MIPDNVTLIVKAPNQQIEDQNIECQSSWTISQLKGHLSEVYPSKPRTEEQKIIYSGQLLEDTTILKDILRTYDSQITHTIHLVCLPKKQPKKMIETPTPAPETNTDGLRQRNVPNVQNVQTTPTETPERPPATEPASRPEMRQNDQNHTVEMQNYLSSFVNNYGRVPPYPNYNFGEGYLPVPNDPALLANHMMMMQQAYLQYMQQYANMWQAATTTPAATPAPPAPEAPQPPAPAPQEDEDGLGARDWLDHLYAASRLAILFSLVYLYGSPARLLLVLLLAGAGYLHQIGFFRDLNIHPQAPAQENARRNDPAGEAQQENDQNDTPADDTTNDTTTTPDNDNQQSLLAVTWMIFTTFFSSLIPDTN